MTGHGKDSETSLIGPTLGHRTHLQSGTPDSETFQILRDGSGLYHMEDWGEREYRTLRPLLWIFVRKFLFGLQQYLPVFLASPTSEPFGSRISLHRYSQFEGQLEGYKKEFTSP